MIKHIIYENGVKQIFKLIVRSGLYAGTYVISKPNGWDDVDSIVDIDEELLFVKNFIIGDSEKLEFFQFAHKETFNLLKSIKNEQGGDGEVSFKWIALKDGIEYDLLKDNFDVNFNKYEESFDTNERKIVVELIKSESQNKLFNRNETTVNIFDTKDLDDKDISPVQTTSIGYKKGDKVLSNFYTYEISQVRLTGRFSDNFFRFMRSSDFEFGDNNNESAGYYNGTRRTEYGPFVATNITLKNLKVEFSNIHFGAERNDGVTPNLRLVIQFRNGGAVIQEYTVENSTPIAGTNQSEIKIDNKIISITEALQPGQNIFITVKSLDGANFQMVSIKDNSTIEITTNMESPLVRTDSVRLIDAISQLSKSYTNNEISVESKLLGLGGTFYDTSISTGMYLRGLPPLYLQKIKTSLKALIDDGLSKLMAVGYDVVDNKMYVESISYFFKDVKVYDLSEKQFARDGYKFSQDSSLAYNNLLFGSKKYSTNNKFDIQNFNTLEEFSTPIKANKAKFDKQTDLIIDPYKIQEMIEDKTSSTNDSDDDLVLIDMVNAINHEDNGVFENTTHANEGGFLVLSCPTLAFDTTLMQPGTSITIKEGYNVGTWTVLEVIDAKIKLNKTSGIQEGTIDTPISYVIQSVTKNRTNEGFTNTSGILDVTKTTNIRHNPKYQMARWFAFFGGGLRKKKNEELLKVTSYKNNSSAKMTISSGFPELAGELQGDVVVGDSETLGRMRDFSETFFNGDLIEIKYLNVTFADFVSIYHNWRYGIDDDRMKSRGYLTLNTPEGILDAYPFGDKAFVHSKSENTLSIKAKVKGKSVDAPILLDVAQIDRNTISLNWNYSDLFINPHIRIQYSTDGQFWTVIHEVDNVKSVTFQSEIFNDLMTGDIVYFRISVSSSDFTSKNSNSLITTWKFNDWVVREISRTENTNCGNSYLTFEVKGTASINVNWDFESYPGGGSAAVINPEDNSSILSFTSEYGEGISDSKNTSFTISHETRQFSINLKNSDRTSDFKILTCLGSGINSPSSAVLWINISDNNSSTMLQLNALTVKKYREGGPIVDPT